jgi:nitrate reductase (NAD(P)H)
MSKYYYIGEIRLHNTKDSCWLIAHNKVYDATGFLKKHPEHSQRILKNAGKDVTEDYDFHTSSHKKIWKQYHIGYVEKSNYQTNCCTIV